MQLESLSTTSPGIASPAVSLTPRCTTLALLALLALGLFSSAACHAQANAPAIQSSASIWFHPQPAFIGPQANGLPQFLPLFEPDAPWQRVLAKTQVIGLYAGWITAASPEVRKRCFEAA